MTIRLLQSDDIDEIKLIHEKFYKREFDLPNFANDFLTSFIVCDDSGIITVAGIKPIAEIIAVTNKDVSPRRRRSALLSILESSSYIGKRYNFDQLHAFVQDCNWERQLKHVGFSDCKGHALYINI